jgi:hypothetical protein
VLALFQLDQLARDARARADQRGYPKRGHHHRRPARSRRRARQASASGGRHLDQRAHRCRVLPGPRRLLRRSRRQLLGNRMGARRQPGRCGPAAPPASPPETPPLRCRMRAARPAKGRFRTRSVGARGRPVGSRRRGLPGHVGGTPKDPRDRPRKRLTMPRLVPHRQQCHPWPGSFTCSRSW